MKKTLATTALLAALATPVFAQSQDDAAIASVKISAADAAKAAEAHTPGRVTALDIDKDDQTGARHYVVELVDPAGKEQKLFVDAMSGAVSVAPADSDHDGEDSESD